MDKTVWYLTLNSLKNSTYNLSFIVSSTAVGSCQSRRTFFQVPGLSSIFWSATNGKGIYAVSIAITIARVMGIATISWCPDKYGSFSLTALHKLKRNIKLDVTIFKLLEKYPVKFIHTHLFVKNLTSNKLDFKLLFEEKLQ